MANPPSLTPEQRQAALEKAARGAPSARRGEGEAEEGSLSSRELFDQGDR